MAVIYRNFRVGLYTGKCSKDNELMNQIYCYACSWLMNSECFISWLRNHSDNINNQLEFRTTVTVCLFSFLMTIMMCIDVNLLTLCLRVKTIESEIY